MHPAHPQQRARSARLVLALAVCLATLARRDQRAIAGLSMGGNGALHYAARHPDLFVAAASWSGADDVFNPIIRPITETTGISEGCAPGAVFGPSVTEELRWRASNPV